MKTILLSILISFSFHIHAANYYFSTSTGLDTRTSIEAQNQLTPWKTITKLNSFFSSLLPGDSILFKKGEIFYGSIIVNKSGTALNPIKFFSYGNGPDPIITGFTQVTGWINLGSNIWESTAAISTLTSCNLVTVNGINTAMGRTPNTGFHTIQGTNGVNTITDAANLNSSILNYTGGEVVVKTARWHLDRGTITGASGSTITFTATDYEPAISWGYFIQNHISTLDIQNEWYFSPTTKKIRVYSTATPGTVKLQTIDQLLYLNGKNYISIKGLSFEGGNYGIKALETAGLNTNVTIANCRFSFFGKDAINLSPNSNTPTITGNTFIECNNIAVQARASDNATINSNYIYNTGNLEGMGESGDYSYTGIISHGDNGVINYNRVIRAGYIGIRFDGNATQVKYNFVDTTNYKKDDGGGIYTNPTQAQTSFTQRTVEGNTVQNSIGNLQGVGGGSTILEAEGLYFDQQTSYLDVINNNVSNCAARGIFMNNCHHMNITGNTVYNCRELLRWNKYQNLGVTNNTVNNNRFIAKTSTQWIMFLANDYDAATNFFTANNNYYARPIDDNVTIVAFADGNGGGLYNLAGWKAFSGQDASSQKSPVSIATTNDLLYQYNETASSQTITLPAKYIDIANVSYPASITLAPYTSAVLIKNGSANISPVANAGTDKTVRLPIRNTTLAGSATDTDGSISSYLWTKISGPATYNIVSPTAATTLITNLIAGQYTFRLTVTDNNGATHTDNVIVNVKKVTKIRTNETLLNYGP